MYVITGQEFDIINDYESYNNYNVCLAKTENEAKKIVDYLNKNTYEQGLFKYTKISTYSLKEIKNKHRYYHVYGYVMLERENHVFKVKDSVIHDVDYFHYLEYLNEDEIIENNEYYNYESGDSRLPYEISCHNTGRNIIYVDIELPISQDKEKTIKKFKMLENKIKFIVNNMAKAGIRSSDGYKQAIDKLLNKEDR